jgi:hypothetical protein
MNAIARYSMVHLFSSLLLMALNPTASVFDSLVVSALASGTEVRGFKLAEDVGFFGPSFGGEVKPFVPCGTFTTCKKSLHLPWESQLQAKFNRPFLAHSSHYLC